MYYIGVDIGGTNIEVGLTEKDGNLLFKKSVETEAEKGFDSIILKISDTITSLLKENRVDLQMVEGIGLGCPGSIDEKNGAVIFSNNIRMQNAPIVAALRSYIDKPVFVSNDANCAALGEMAAGRAKGLKNVVLVTLGTGVGGGVIIDGKVFGGNNGAGAELGHAVIRLGGIRCTCGRNGCWEAYASATALIALTKKEIALHPESAMKDAREINGRTAFEAAKKGDRAGIEIVDTYLNYVAEGIVNAINIFRPDIVLIGGGISNEGEYILSPIQDYVNQNCFGSQYLTPPKVELATLGNKAGIIGAAMLCAKVD